MILACVTYHAMVCAEGAPLLPRNLTSGLGAGDNQMTNQCLPDSREKTEMLQKIYSWILDQLYDHDQGYFYYRLYKNKLDKKPYIRWSESWMLRAQSYLI